jgi:hypothetical protein
MWPSTIGFGGLNRSSRVSTWYGATAIGPSRQVWVCFVPEVAVTVQLPVGSLAAAGAARTSMARTRETGRASRITTVSIGVFLQVD